VVKSVFSGLAAVFQGISSLNLDAKGRLSMPTRYRDALSDSGNQITITRHPDGCLMVFPRTEWRGFSDRIARLPAEAVWYRRFFLGNAMDVDMDATGRVLVAPELRTAAGLTKEAVLLGMGSYLELWDASTYAAKEAEAMQQPMPDALKGFIF
jgi:MraZ protein